MATISVSPIHFEDYSGVQFERLVFAYHVCAGWRDLIWHGQSGGDRVRDISGIEAFDDQPARKTIIQLEKNVQAASQISWRDVVIPAPKGPVESVKRSV